MSRKIFLFLLVFALAVGTLSVRATPTVAASSTDSNTAFADLLPADVAVYANLRTANLQDTVGIITDLIGRLAGIKPTKPYQQIDDGLTQLLGRDASVEKDILPWLGDNVAAAYLISDADLAAMQKNGATAMMQSQEALIIVGVKDQAKGDVFLKQVLSAITRMSPNMLSGTAKTITLNGASASEYVGPQGTLVQGKGFYAIGQSAAVNEMIDAVSNSKPTLAADPDFWATMKLLKTNNLVSVFLGQRFYQALLASATARMMTEPGMLATPSVGGQDGGTNRFQQVLAAIRGQGLGGHIEDKSLILDLGTAIDPDKMLTMVRTLSGPTFTMPKVPTLTQKLADVIPGDALAVIDVSGGLSAVYPALKAALPAIEKLNPSASRAGRVAPALTLFENLVSSQFNLTPNDVFGWMTGEFAIYATYNTRSVIDQMARGQRRSNQWPFDHTLLIKTDAPDKAKSFITKLTSGLQAMSSITVDTTGDFTSVSAPSGPAVVSYGLSGTTFVLTTSTGLTKAQEGLAGNNVLSANATYKAAQINALRPANVAWYLNIGALVPILKTFVTQQQLSDSQTAQFFSALGEFDSAALFAYGDQVAGTSVISLQLTLK